MDKIAAYLYQRQSISENTPFLARSVICLFLINKHDRPWGLDCICLGFTSGLKDFRDRVLR